MKGYWPTTQKIPFSRGPSRVLCLKSSPNNHCPHDNYPESSKRHSRGVAFRLYESTGALDAIAIEHSHTLPPFGDKRNKRTGPDGRYLRDPEVQSAYFVYQISSCAADAKEKRASRLRKSHHHYRNLNTRPIDSALPSRHIISFNHLGRPTRLPATGPEFQLLSCIRPDLRNNG